MSGGRISQPVGKIVLTNVAVVRMRKGGKRFEIACYKNKVFNWRNGVEEDIDEVLQIAKGYENVSKGKFAKKSDWAKAFSVQSEEQACRAILDHGELQVSEGERKALVEKYAATSQPLTETVAFASAEGSHCIIYLSSAACTVISPRLWPTSA
jgi:ribosome maturation protein SDO1